MLHQVGVGALGPVFRTYEPTRDRLVAVKVFRLDVTPEQAQSLADELSVAAGAGLFHPSIVEPIAAGVEGTVAYRAEEYVAAETLDVALRHYAPAPIEKVLPIVTQLAGALDFARTAGVGHGALHPRDIFVTPEETRATGFGVVEALERVGLRAPVRRPYSAPERVAGAEWGAAADVFSLAVIAYELLTGRRPSGTGAQIGAVTGTTAGAHPGELHAVFVRALDEAPARRYQTALEFASALDAAARGMADVAAAPAAGAAGLAAAAAPDDPQDPPDDLPALEDVDAQAEPVAAEQEEDLFRADEPDFDDVLAEKDEDEAHAVLLKEEEAFEAAGGDPRSERDRLLFDDEAVEDLALEEPVHAGTDRFADEFAVAADGASGNDGGAELEADADFEEPAQEPDPDAFVTPDRTYAQDDLEEEAPATSAYGGTAYDAPVLQDRPRPSMLSYAVVAVLGLLVGFAAGHAVGKRTATDTAAGAATGTSQEAATPYSEETLVSPEPLTPAPAAAAQAPAQASPPTETAPESPVTTGRLVVRSTPAGAAVTVDGDWRGRTPLSLDDVPFGTREVRVVQNGYDIASERVTLSSGTPSRTLSFRLQRTAPAAPRPRPAPPASQSRAPQTFTGSIYVDSRPRGASVFLDNKLMGKTPVRIPDVPVGSHVVRLQLPDHSNWSTSTRVVSGQEARVTGSLERIR